MCHRREVKTPEERGPFPTWVVETRNALDLTTEWVAQQTGYDDATIRKLEGGTVTRPQRRKVTELLQRVAAERGMRIAPPPREGAPTTGGGEADLAAAIREQARALSDLAEAIRGERASLSPESVRLFLKQLVEEGLLALPGAASSTGEPQRPRADQ